MASHMVKAFGVGLLALGIALTMAARPVFPADVGVTLELAPGAPPPPRYEAVPPPPLGPPERVFWVKGRWHWDGAHWAWVPGHYVERPRREAMWVEGHWDHRPNGWVWVDGHWR